MDYFLKADSETALMAALEAAGAIKSIEVKDETGKVIETRFAVLPGYNLDIIGTIRKPTGNLIQQTIGDTIVETAETVELPGFHANLRGPADLAPKVEYIPYTPTMSESLNPDFIMPEPTKVETPSPIQSLLVYPQNPVRTWF